MTYFSDAQIYEMADAAFASYEMTACKTAAATAAREYARDEFGVNPNNTAVLLAVKYAITSWGETTLRTKNIISA
jgi:hypothetical protein